MDQTSPAASCYWLQSAAHPGSRLWHSPQLQQFSQSAIREARDKAPSSDLYPHSSYSPYMTLDLYNTLWLTQLSPASSSWWGLCTIPRAEPWSNQPKAAKFILSNSAVVKENLLLETILRKEQNKESGLLLTKQREDMRSLKDTSKKKQRHYGKIGLYWSVLAALVNLLKAAAYPIDSRIPSYVL